MIWSSLFAKHYKIHNANLLQEGPAWLRVGPLWSVCANVNISCGVYCVRLWSYIRWELFSMGSSWGNQTSWVQFEHRSQDPSLLWEVFWDTIPSAQDRYGCSSRFCSRSYGKLGAYNIQVSEYKFVYKQEGKGQCLLSRFILCNCMYPTGFGKIFLVHTMAAYGSWICIPLILNWVVGRGWMVMVGLLSGYGCFGEWISSPPPLLGIKTPFIICPAHLLYSCYILTSLHVNEIKIFLRKLLNVYSHTSKQCSTYLWFKVNLFI